MSSVNNSATAKKQLNLLFFFGAVVLSLLMAAGSGYFVKQLLAGDAGKVPAASKACLATLKANQFTAIQPTPDTIKVRVTADTDTEAWVARSGVVIASCPTYKLAEYCVGSGCTKRGLSFTLRKK